MRKKKSPTFYLSLLSRVHVQNKNIQKEEADTRTVYVTCFIS